MTAQPKDENIRIVAIGGSVRSGNFTAKALALAVDEIRTNHPDVTVEVFDPATLNLALPGADDSGGPSSQVKQLNDAMTSATGVILATPEYHGSYSSVIKLVIDNLGFPSAVSGKPVALMGVAAGQIGAIKALEHLRSVCSHIGGIVLPGPVSVAGCEQSLRRPGPLHRRSVRKTYPRNRDQPDPLHPQPHLPEAGARSHGAGIIFVKQLPLGERLLCEVGWASCPPRLPTKSLTLATTSLFHIRVVLALKVDLQVPAQVVCADVKRDRVERRDGKFKHVPGSDQHDQLCHDRRILIDHTRQPAHVVRNANHRDGINELTDKCRTIIAKPEMFALGQSFPEMEQIHIAELGCDVGNHRSRHGSKRQRADLEKHRQLARCVGNHPPVSGSNGSNPRQHTA